MRHAWLATLSLLVACSGGNDRERAGSSDLVGQATLSLTQTPSGIGCIRFVVTPASGNAVTINETISPTTGGVSSANFNLGQLPIGNVTFTGFAYTPACGNVNASAVAQWIADPVPTTLQAGVPASVTLTFKRNNPVTGTANFVDDLAGLAIGPYATFGLAGPPNNVSVRLWGEIGAPISQLLPTLPAGVTNFAAISAGDQSQCALTADGNVWCWGYEGWGQLGPNEPETGNVTSTMYQVPLPGPAIQISSGDRFSCALVKNGPAYCWGFDGSGQIDGIPAPFSRPTPAKSDGYPASWISAGGSHRCTVLSAAGAVYCYGDNSAGQLGTGGTSGTTGQPINNGAVSVACGVEHSCALMASGQVQCWGYNASGQLGNGGTTNSSTPVAVALPAPAVEIAATWATTCARLASGSVYCWGDNTFGELGSASALRVSPTPTQVSGITNATRLFGGEAANHLCVQLADQSVRCWGFNAWGQLGDGTLTSRFTPVPLQE